MASGTSAKLTRGKAEKFMKIFAYLCPAASSHSMLCFDAFARDRDLLILEYSTDIKPTIVTSSDVPKRIVWGLL
eukprot:symbB.v1.2.026441.t2/scaffold2584.1/size75688/1